MEFLKQLYKFIRLPNLVIIVVTQALVYFGILNEAFNEFNIQSEVGTSGFVLLTVITLIIALDGYIINDMIDVPTDLINRPGKNFIGQYLTISQARWIYLVLFIAGFILSAIYAVDRNVLQLLFIYPLAFALLAFYSFRLKKTLLAGNVIVALFSAFVTGIFIIFDWQPLMQLKLVALLSYTSATTLVFAFMVFAFLSSVFREIVKDLEDLEGDRGTNLKTTAIRLGERKAQFTAMVVGGILCITLLYWSFHSLNKLNIWLHFFGILLSAYNVLILYRLYKSKTKREYGYVSNSIKLLMAAGMMYLFAYSILI
jgi:4-hydroxybenzoate polyprenyltransferase